MSHCSSTRVSIQLDEYGFRTEYFPVDPTPYEAEQGAALWRSADYQEGLGRDMYTNGCPVADCPTRAAVRGWEAAQQAELDAATLEGQLTGQIGRNDAVLAENAVRLAVYTL